MKMNPSVSKIMKRIKPYIPLLVLAMLCALISVGLTLYIPVLIGDAIDSFEGVVVLNEVSAYLFGLMEAPMSLDDLVARVVQEYQVDPAVALRDVKEALEKMKQLGIVHE